MLTPASSCLPVMVLDTHPIFRFGLTNLFAREPDLQVVWSGGDPRAAVDELTKLRPAVLITEFHLKVTFAPDVIRQVHAVIPDLPVVVLTGETKELAIRETLEAGAIGYLLKENEPAVLIRAIRAAARGEAVLDPILAGLVLHWVQAMSDDAPLAPSGSLTAREIETVRLVAQGWSNKRVAEEMVLSIRTVENHLRNIYHKLGLTDRTQLIRYAIQRGLLPPPRKVSTAGRAQDWLPTSN